MSQPNANAAMDPLVQRKLCPCGGSSGRVKAAARSSGKAGMVALLSGAEPLQPRVLERASKALIAHADACRAMERRISPAFTAKPHHAQIGGNASGNPRWRSSARCAVRRTTGTLA
jgi:hypothetical protein